MNEIIYLIWANKTKILFETACTELKASKNINSKVEIHIKTVSKRVKKNMSASKIYTKKDFYE